jgi:hypothetical protein
MCLPPSLRRKTSANFAALVAPRASADIVVADACRLRFSVLDPVGTSDVFRRPPPRPHVHMPSLLTPPRPNTFRPLAFVRFSFFVSRFRFFFSFLLFVFFPPFFSFLLCFSAASDLLPPSTPAPLASLPCQHQPPTPVALISDDGRAGSAAQGWRFWL